MLVKKFEEEALRDIPSKSVNSIPKRESRIRYSGLSFFYVCFNKLVLDSVNLFFVYFFDILLERHSH